MLEFISDGSIWKGEAIDDVRHPKDIETKWTEAELAAIGLQTHVPPVDDTILPTHVQGERDRRLSLGFDYDFGDERGVHRIGTTPADLVGWRDVSDYANALVGTGDTQSTIAIVTDTGPASVTGPEWLDILKAAAEFRQPLWAGSFVLQMMDPIPADYASNDTYWT